jgi:glutamine amidotransferase
MQTIAVIDYGMGNLRSVSKALEHVAPGARVVVTADPGEIEAAERVVFPGQGAMPDCMRELDSRGLRPSIFDAAQRKPFLGICIGLQMLFERSDEGDIPGLGILRGKVRKFSIDPSAAPGEARLKVPHMGWNEVRQEASHPLWDGIGQDSRFYFVHSYYPEPADERVVTGTSRYPLRFTCAVARDNIFAVQFHPEKSQAAGLVLLRNFSSWDGSVPRGA